MNDRATQAEAEREPQNGGVRSVRRALDILNLLGEDRPVITLREITDATGLAKTTALRLIQTLEESGLLWSDPAGYIAGPGLWRWAYLARSQWEVPRETRKVMRDLADRLGETVNVFVARDLRRVCVAHEESPHPLRHVVDIGDEQPLWAGASSKVLLRDASDTLLHRVAASSPHGEAYAEELRTRAQEAAYRGYAVSSSEWDEGLTAVAVPITSRSSRVIASLSLSGPSHRFPYEAVERFAADLSEAAGLISDHGFSHPLGPNR
ncbi:IclR family transcriptional regulator [Streptomyces caniscabiei]|uniref:IclR family transcriptional regulator n=1 Tax=Streptomyces caniscabiei TaxID=2746961 RepID=UPI0029A0EC4E|nr:IclR family transcriptional regulator [Streptomyces caniscabiei]MDX2602813.1 IclR family transcriptional regulator [Streptomyces caniscabiei]MDX2737900.1 IclR family transcriptional regulator [Streptomyces caniscabiei]MDX2783375.1 IclR family transcriptional regulator [Streptomyces caniscabiei]